MNQPFLNANNTCEVFVKINNNGGRGRNKMSSNSNSTSGGGVDRIEKLQRIEQVLWGKCLV